MLKKVPPKERLYQLLPELLQPPEMRGKQYLHVYLNTDYPVLIPMSHVEGVVNIPATYITPLHSMPPAVLGLMHNNSNICIAVDMATLLGITTMPIVRQHYSIMVLRSASADTLFQQKLSSSSLLGLIIHRFQGLLRLESDKVYPPQTNPEHLLDPYTLGWVEHIPKNLPILSPQSIFDTASSTK